MKKDGMEIRIRKRHSIGTGRLRMKGIIWLSGACGRQMGKKNKDGQQILTGIIRMKLQTIQLFRLEKFFVSCW
jgi:hypothetical protein